MPRGDKEVIRSLQPYTSANTSTAKGGCNRNKPEQEAPDVTLVLALMLREMFSLPGSNTTLRALFPAMQGYMLTGIHLVQGGGPSNSLKQP